MRMRIESPGIRALLGLGIFAAILALCFLMLSAATGPNGLRDQAALLFISGPVGALVTHLHVPLFALLVLILTPLVVAASVNRLRRKLFLSVIVCIWFTLGIMFASIQ